MYNVTKGRSQIPVLDLTGRARSGRAGDLAGKILEESMRRYPFMNNNACQIYFILY